jgi:hypothetical protein
MAFEHKPNAGSIFRNGYKTKPEHPDHQGSCKVVCEKCGHHTDLKISAWINDLKDKTGKYFGLSFSKPQPAAQRETPVDFDPDEDIPF